MSLGIKRESLGDIVINDEGLFIACTEEISKYIEQEFKFIGKAPIELERYDGEVLNVIKYEDKDYFISSLRIDCVIAGIYGISRSEALELIMGGLVQVNHIINMNPSHVLKIDDIVSVRHKGKFKVTSLNGKTRSDRLNVTLSRRI
jgi:RNA-binding protein YlmH